MVGEWWAVWVHGMVPGGGRDCIAHWTTEPVVESWTCEGEQVANAPYPQEDPVGAGVEGAGGDGGEGGRGGGGRGTRGGGGLAPHPAQRNVH